MGPSSTYLETSTGNIRTNNWRTHIRNIVLVKAKNGSIAGITGYNIKLPYGTRTAKISNELFTIKIQNLP